MEDTPANYNLANQRIMPKQYNKNGLTIPEEQDDTLQQNSEMSNGKKKFKKRKRLMNVEVLQPTA